MNNQIWIHLDTSVILPTSPGLAAHHPALELPQDLRSFNMSESEHVIL